MLLSGSIRKFDLASVLQFLAQEHATGIVEVRDFDEFGFIYLIEGRVQAISLPMTDEKLGTRLLRAGLLTEQQLSEVLMADTLLSKEEKKAKPLGQRLLDKGYITADQVRDIMAKQTLDQIFALAQWQNGVFEFDESDKMPEFTIRIVGSVQELLLDAYRRIDEGETLKTSEDGSRQRGVLRLSRRERVQRRHQGEVPQARRVPVAAHGGDHRRRLRTRAGRPEALQVARGEREAHARNGARLRRQPRPRFMRLDESPPDFERRAPVWGRRVFDRFLSDLIDAIPEGIYVTNDEREIVYWSEGAEHITGYSAADVVGSHCFDDILVHEDVYGHKLCAGSCPLEECIADGRAAQPERGLPQARRRRAAGGLRQDAALHDRQPDLRRRGLR